MKRLMGILLGIMMSAAMFTACGSKAAVSIDLSDYLHAVYRGYDGSATARGDFDYTGFEKAVAAGTRSDAFNLNKIVRFETSMIITVSPDSDLHVGDKVTVTAAYDKEAAREAGIRIRGNSRTFTVEGLHVSPDAPEDEPHGTAAELDAFDPACWNTADGISIEYAGTSPYGWLELKNNLPADHPLSYVSYSFSEQQNVHEGDQITVTARLQNSRMRDTYYLKDLTTVYTAGAIDHYLLETSELGRDTVAAIQASAQERAAEDASGTLQFQTASDYKGFYNGETVTINANQAGDAVYTFRNRDGFLEALAIPCYMNVTVQEPDWMEDPQTYDYDLVFLCTVSEIIVHADGSVTMNPAEVRNKGTADTEALLLEDLKTWYGEDEVETVDLGL